MAEMMEQAEGFAEQPAPNMGMVNEPEAMPPQEGGEKSVADDIPQKADEGDYILPYETVLMYGLNQLNRYAKEAIKLAMENNVDLTGTNLDPTDDVPIRISNYEYRIPKGLVPFFGGGKKYLDKIRKEGLELRQRLAEEGGEDVAEQQKAEAPVQEQGFAPQAPQVPMEAMPAEAMPAEAMPAPMMQKGGFVLSKDKDAEILEQDKPESAESKRIQAQQPAMVTPDGKKTQQGLSAPMGYANGGDIMSGLGFAMQDVTPANVGTLLQNAKDATNLLTGMQKAFVEKQRTDERLA
tara:strand:- start:6 stop:887 length:882 start_codon:yes stop_codon:yes gene_type:complete